MHALPHFEFDLCFHKLEGHSNSIREIELVHGKKQKNYLFMHKLLRITCFTIITLDSPEAQISENHFQFESQFGSLKSLF